MPTTYQTADDDVLDLLAAVMRESHPRLVEAGVKVGVTMALNPDGPAIRHGGYEALAQIKVVSLKDRLRKGIDAEMFVDESEWNRLDDDQREALLDHELSHLSLAWLTAKQLAALRHDNPEAPAWKLDDLGRPKLKSVPGDWNAGDGFAAVVERHGRAAVEFLNLSRCYARAKAACRGGPGGHPADLPGGDRAEDA